MMKMSFLCGRTVLAEVSSAKEKESLFVLFGHEGVDQPLRGGLCGSGAQGQE